MTTFKQGQRVVCIDATHANGPLDEEPIKEDWSVVQDGEYIIDEMYEGMLHFRECPNPDLFFESCDFRPLQPDHAFVEGVMEFINLSITHPS